MVERILMEQMGFVEKEYRIDFFGSSGEFVGELEVSDEPAVSERSRLTKRALRGRGYWQAHSQRIAMRVD